MQERPSHGPIETLSAWISHVAMWLPALIVVIMLLDIVYRYILISSTMWVNETALWLGGVIYLSSGLYAMHHRSHIRISVLYDMVPRKVQILFDVLSVFCFMFFTFWVVWGGYNTTLRKFLSWERLGTVFDPPIPATNKILILTLLCLFTIQIISNFIRDWNMPSLVRKIYDVCITVLVSVLSLYLMAMMIGWTDHNPSKIPAIWRVVITGGMGVFVVAVVWGLIRDFNTRSDSFVESPHMDL